MLLISVDGGTTNTRLVLICDGKVLCAKRLSIGLRDHEIGEDTPYPSHLAKGIAELLAENHLQESDLDAVTVSGMICAEGGLYALPHISAPVDCKKLAGAMKKMQFPEIADVPFYLIPGVKTVTESSELSESDIMRGEETELYGIIEKMNLGGDVTLVLPGSHCKIIPTGADGSFGTFSTTVSGELIRATAEHTILRDGIQNAFPKELDKEALLWGFDYAREHGVSEALFKVRILQKFRGYTKEQLYSALAGAILSEDIRVIETRGRGKILVGGSDPYRSAITFLVNERSRLSATVIPEEVAQYAVAYGAERLMKEVNP